MSELPALLLACVAGAVLGAVFFGGLWWTVQKSLTFRRPALWLFASLILRMSIALAGFYLVGQAQWERLMACLLGFLAARLIVTWRTRLQPNLPAKQTRPVEEVRHAP